MCTRLPPSISDAKRSLRQVRTAGVLRSARRLPEAYATLAYRDLVQQGIVCSLQQDYRAMSIHAAARKVTI